MSDKRYTLQVSQREFDALMAGLCCLEVEMASDGGLDETIALVLTNGDEHEGMEAYEVGRLRERLNEPDLPEYLVVYEHLQGTDIFRIRSQSLGGHIGSNSFEDRDPVITALRQALGLVFETGEIINIFSMPTVKGVFTFKEPT